MLSGNTKRPKPALWWFYKPVRLHKVYQETHHNTSITLCRNKSTVPVCSLGDCDCGKEEHNYSKNTKTGANTYYYTLYGDKRPKSNQWTMVTGTYDGLNRNLYVDGNLVDSKSEKVNILNDRPFDMAIGCALEDGQTAWWRIAAVRIYTRAVSSAEVKALSDLEKPKSK